MQITVGCTVQRFPTIYVKYHATLSGMAQSRAFDASANLQGTLNQLCYPALQQACVLPGAVLPDSYWCRVSLHLPVCV